MNKHLGRLSTTAMLALLCANCGLGRSPQSGASSGTCADSRQLSDSAAGVIRIGLPVKSIGALCPVIAYPEATDSEGDPVDRVGVIVGGDTVSVDLGAGRVRRIRVESSAFSTSDGIHVGSSMSELRSVGPLSAVYGDGLLAVRQSGRCGLSYQFDGPDIDQLLRNRSDAEVLAAVPAESRVSAIIVRGC